MVDLNELRVTPSLALSQLIGHTVPLASEKAQRIVDALNAIRKREDTMDLTFLRHRGRREAKEYLESSFKHIRREQALVRHELADLKSAVEEISRQCRELDNAIKSSEKAPVVIRREIPEVPENIHESEKNRPFFTRIFEAGE